MNNIGITAQEARRLVGDTSWKFIQRGFVGYSRNMKWEVIKGGYLYWKRPCKPTW